MVRSSLLIACIAGGWPGVSATAATNNLFDSLAADSSLIRVSTSVSFVGHSIPAGGLSQALAVGTSRQALMCLDNTRWFAFISFKSSEYGSDNFSVTSALSPENIEVVRYGAGFGRILHVAKKLEITPFIMLDYAYVRSKSETVPPEDFSFLSLPTVGCYADFDVLSIPIKQGDVIAMKRWDWGLRGSIDIAPLDLRELAIGQSLTVNWSLALMIRLHF